MILNITSAEYVSLPATEVLFDLNFVDQFVDPLPVKQLIHIFREVPAVRQTSGNLLICES